MEKYGVGGDSHTVALRDEEANLMQKMAAYMSGEKRANESDEGYIRIQSRLQEVREKLTAIDLKKEQ